MKTFQLFVYFIANLIGFLVVAIFLELLWKNYQYSHLLSWQNEYINPKTFYHLKVSDNNTRAADKNFVDIDVILVTKWEGESAKDGKRLIKNQTVTILKSKIDYKKDDVIYYPVDNVKMLLAIDKKGEKHYYFLSGRSMDTNNKIAVDNKMLEDKSFNQNMYLGLVFLFLILSVVLLRIGFEKINDVEYHHKKLEIVIGSFVNGVFLLFVFFHIFRLMTY